MELGSGELKSIHTIQESPRTPVLVHESHKGVTFAKGDDACANKTPPPFLHVTVGQLEPT